MDIPDGPKCGPTVLRVDFTITNYRFVSLIITHKTGKIGSASIVISLSSTQKINGSLGPTHSIVIQKKEKEEGEEEKDGRPLSREAERSKKGKIDTVYAYTHRNGSCFH